MATRGDGLFPPKINKTKFIGHFERPEYLEKSKILELLLVGKDELHWLTKT